MKVEDIECEIDKYLIQHHVQDYVLVIHDGVALRVKESLGLSQLALLIKILEKRLDKGLNESLYN